MTEPEDKDDHRSCNNPQADGKPQTNGAQGEQVL
ncbi:hypothetical protein MOMUL_19410 [Moorella mulderi DSM 14980]|uniref:Uncharacterized protein n=1 Tax=Moorella mulderi DSM 14980 TaxID=1122241 RepID=A0A151AVY7_9FIRM|nr:hypothetical protein MOMUL_19410 [Moorella mulderi DSM 14980]